MAYLFVECMPTITRSGQQVFYKNVEQKEISLKNKKLKKFYIQNPD